MDHDLINEIPKHKKKKPKHKSPKKSGHKHLWEKCFIEWDGRDGIDGTPKHFSRPSFYCTICGKLKYVNLCWLWGQKEVDDWNSSLMPTFQVHSSSDIYINK